MTPNPVVTSSPPSNSTRAKDGATLENVMNVNPQVTLNVEWARFYNRQFVFCLRKGLMTLGKYQCKMRDKHMRLAHAIKARDCA